MFWLFAVVILGVVILGIVLLQKQQNAPAEAGRQAPSNRRSIFELQIGDIVQYQADDWVVEGTLIYDDSGFTWVEYLLQEGDRIRWLSVEEDDIVTVTFSETVSDLYIQSDPPEVVDYQGEEFRLNESGQASMTRTGNTLQRRAQYCRYFEYKGPENRVLSIEDWSGDWEVSIGHTLPPRDLILLPGQGASVYRDI